MGCVRDHLHCHAVPQHRLENIGDDNSVVLTLEVKNRNRPTCEIRIDRRDISRMRFGFMSCRVPTAQPRPRVMPRCEERLLQIFEPLRLR